MAPSYNTMEMMICVAARYLEDGKTVAVGTGAPCAAAMLSQKTQSPNLVILFEAGGISPLLPQMPISVGDSRTFFRAVMPAAMTARRNKMFEKTVVSSTYNSLRLAVNIM